jgi:hypothetical protein
MNDLSLPERFSRDPLAALLRDPLVRMRLPLWPILRRASRST